MSRKDWQRYFACEKDFYAWLAQDGVTTSLHGIGERTYIEKTCCVSDELIYEPPRYIRHVAVLHDNCIAEFHQRFAELKALHKIAVTSIKKPDQHLPFRTPMLINDYIEHISISVKDAYKSTRLKKGEHVILSSVPNNDKADSLVKAIQNAGMSVIYTPEEIPIFIETPFDDFASFAGTDNIQSRYSTGQQHTARLRIKGESYSKPMRYGYILLKQRADVVEANKQAKRPHVMDRKWRKIELPFDVDRSFYDLNAPL